MDVCLIAEIIGYELMFQSGLLTWKIKHQSSYFLNTLPMNEFWA